MYRPPIKKRSATSCAPGSRAKRDITGAKRRLKAFLLRNDIRYSGRATCVTHAIYRYPMTEGAPVEPARIPPSITSSAPVI
jgi:hypothetical protein